jgi:hypothetical protein
METASRMQTVPTDAFDRSRDQQRASVTSTCVRKPKCQARIGKVQHL